MSYKDFDAMLNEKLSGRPDFKVGGHTFTARAKLPWKKFSNLILSMSGDDVSSTNGISKTEDFFKLVLIPTDRQRFIDLLNHDGDEDDDDDSVIAPEQVSEILDWLLAYYTGKAGASESASSEQQPGTGLPLNVVSASLSPKIEA